MQCRFKSINLLHSQRNKSSIEHFYTSHCKNQQQPMEWNVRYAPPHLTPTRQVVHSPLPVHTVEPAGKNTAFEKTGVC